MKTSYQSKGHGFQVSATSDRVMAGFRAALAEARTTISQILAGQGAEAIAVELAAEGQGSNTIESQAKLELSMTVRGGLLSYDMVAPLQMGKIILSEAVVLSAFNDAKKAMAERPVMASGSPIATLDVDLNKVMAERQGDLVIYTSVELPTWQFHAAVESLKNPVNHALIASRILASIRGNCLSDFHRVAAFKQADFALPVVCEKVEPTVKASEVPGFRPEDFAPAAIQERIIGSNLVSAGTIRPEERPAHEVVAEQQRFDFENGLRNPVTAAATAHLIAKYKAELPVVLALDFKPTRRRLDGFAAGKVLATVRFYADNSLQETELEMPFGPEGLVDADKIIKSAKSVEAEAGREAELKVLSEQQAKDQLEAYRREADVKASLLLEGATAQGANYATSPAVARVPVLKALLPVDVKVGDKFDLKGYIYQVAATDYNSVSVESSAFWMLCLTDDLPGKFPTLGLWG